MILRILTSAIIMKLSVYWTSSRFILKLFQFTMFYKRFFNLGKFLSDDFIKWSSVLIRMDFLLVAFFSQDHKINVIASCFHNLQTKGCIKHLLVPSHFTKLQ